MTDNSKQYIMQQSMFAKYSFKGRMLCGNGNGKTNIVDEYNQEICGDCKQNPPLDAIKKYKKDSAYKFCCRTVCLTPVSSLKRTHCGIYCKRLCQNHNPDNKTINQRRQDLIKDGKKPCHNLECPWERFSSNHPHCGVCATNCITCQQEKHFI